MIISEIIEIRRFSSSNLSCSLLLSLIRWSLSKSNGLKRISSRVRTRDIATNERPAANSFSLRSIIAFFNIRPWLLYIVIAHASRIGICRREQIIYYCNYYNYYILKKYNTYSIQFLISWFIKSLWTHNGFRFLVMLKGRSILKSSKLSIMLYQMLDY